MTRKHTWGTLCYYAVAVLLALIALVPFFWMISTSLKSRGALMSIPIEWIPAEPTLDAYPTVFERFPFFQTILNSLFISVSYTVITLFSASLAAYAFTKIRFKGSGFLLGVYLAVSYTHLFRAAHRTHHCARLSQRSMQNMPCRPHWF